MINLLPPKEKEGITWQKKFRLVFILGFFSIFCFFVLWLILSAVKIQINYQKNTQFFLTKIESAQVSELKKVKAKINEINQTLSEINKFYDSQVSISALLSKISSILDEGVYLNTFIFDEANQRVDISGYVADLAGLNKLREDFRGEASFEELDFSIPAYIPSEKIDFKVSFVIKA